MMDARTKTVGLLLAGGRSSRMAPAFAGATGGDKGLLDLEGVPMMAHVIRRLEPQVGKMVINANGDPARFASFGLPVVADTIEDYAGPLAGILAGLQWTKANAPQATHVASVSTDAPFVPSTLVERLTAVLAARPAGIPLAASGGELHPVIGLWPVALADDLNTALRSGTRKVLKWTDTHGTIPVDFPFEDYDGTRIDPFFNANTPEELDQARKLLHTSLTTKTVGRL
jgi:molybdenum cofactor guanylyltransferase